ncbi:hypothetical protein LIER_08686 [Lithospermum erythrorhizon]|uniref:Uncharacterized protein n=1 Tax=Lithospermum erythrorhizon TaxID=34254 RepID=A0AAV3PE47_LITER
MRTPTEARPRLFSKRQKSISHKLPVSEILDLTEDPPFSTLPDQEVPRESSSLNPSTLESLPEEGADSVPKAKIGYSANFLELPYTLPGGFQITEDSSLWKKSDAFRASRNLLLERIRKDYDSNRDPLEVHYVVAYHLIRAMNASYVIAYRADLLDDGREEEASKKERAAELRVKELEEENERLKSASQIALKEKKEATAQTLAEIKKQDALQAQFTRLEGEDFDISQRLERFQLVHNHTTKNLGELEQKAKSVEEALPLRIQEAITNYQRSEECRLEAAKEAAYCLCRFTKSYMMSILLLWRTTKTSSRHTLKNGSLLLTFPLISLPSRTTKEEMSPLRPLMPLPLDCFIFVLSL